MKKKLAMLLAAAMVIGSMPISAFAYSSNGVSKVVTAQTDHKLSISEAPILLLEDKNDSFKSYMEFDLTLSGAEWLNDSDADKNITGFYDASGNKVSDGGSVDPDPTPDFNKELAEYQYRDLKDKYDSEARGLIAATGVSTADELTDAALATYITAEEAKVTAAAGVMATALASYANLKSVHHIAAADLTYAKAEEIVNGMRADIDAVQAAVDAANDALTALDATTANTLAEEEAAAALATAWEAVGDAVDAMTYFDPAKVDFSSLTAPVKGNANDLATVEGLLLTSADFGKDYTDGKDALATFKGVVDALDAVKKDVEDFKTAKKDLADIVADIEKNGGTINDDDSITWDTTAMGAAEVMKAAEPSTLPGGLTPGDTYIYVERISSKVATVYAHNYEGGIIRIPMIAELTDDGEATVTVDPMESEVSGGTYTIAVASDGGTKTTIESKSDFQDPVKIKPLIITEVAAGSIDGDVELKLNSGFKFVMKDGSDATKVSASIGTDIFESKVELKNAGTDKEDQQILVLKYKGSLSTKTSKFIVDNIWIKEDGADAGDVATITISKGGTTKETLDVATYKEYGVSVTADDKDLPELHSGSFNEDDDALEVTFKETIVNSWLSNRKTSFTFPDGVKINSVEFKNVKNLKNNSDLQDVDIKAGEIETPSSNGLVTIDNDKNQLIIQGVDVQDNKKAEFKMIFNLSIAADFSGDIDMVVGGAGVEEDQTVTVATAVQPVTVESPVNEVLIDYRDTQIGDIIIKENYAGALESGKILTLEAENMQFESGIEYEVLEGDIKIKEVKKSGGNIRLEVDSESSKTPATIKLSGLKLYMDRSLPAGDYKLSIVPRSTDSGIADDEAVIKNHRSSEKAYETGKATVDCDEVVIMKDFVKIVTAGREQDDSTFTTQLIVKIGEPTMTAGTKTINLDVPAYINAEGYTMLPVRAVTEALSGSAIVNWDNTTRKVTIIFGSRIISMTVGDTNMTINGTVVPMSSQCVITGERAFIPLRDLGYALGLSDSKINWDPATSTATLN